MEINRSELLLERIKNSGRTVAELADAAKMDRSTLYRKLKDPPEQFSVKQADKLRTLLNLSKIDFDAIFF